MNKFLQNTLLFFLLAGLAYGCKTSSKATVSKADQELADSLAIMKRRTNAAMFSDALKEKLAGNDLKAIEKFENAMRVYPDDHASMYELAELYARRGRLSEALVMMQQAVALQPDNEWYQIRIAQLYKFTGDFEALTAVYRQLLKQKPGNIDYFGELSSALLMLGRVDEVLQVYDEIEKQSGVNEVLAMQKHSIYMSRNETEKAIQEIEKLAKSFPFETRYHAMLAELFLKHGPREKALYHYEQILQIDPNDPFARISLAEFYRDGGDENRAFDELLKAFANPALDVETKVQVMVFWFEGQTVTEELNAKADQIAAVLMSVHPQSPRGYQLMADVQMRRQDYEGAKNSFLKALELDKSVFLVWESLLFSIIQLSDYEALGTYARQALALFPEQPILYLFDGYSRYFEKDFQGAVKSLETGRRLVIGNDRLLGEFFSTLGDAYHQLKNYTASFDAYRKALAINPANFAVLNNYAYYLSLRNEQLDKALEMSAKSIEMQPENPSFLDTYAWILYKMGDYQNALIWIEKALNFKTEANPTLYEHYGDILYKLDRKKEALQQWNNAVKTGKEGGSEFLKKKVKDGILYE